MATRLDRIEALEQATKDYVREEKKRIENEVSVLEAVLKGRTGGRGLQLKSTSIVAAVAQNDLVAYLKG